MRSILSSAPLDLIDLLFYFEGFEVIEFWFMRLKFCMELVLAGFFLSPVRSALECLLLPIDTYSFIPLKEHHSATLITSRKVITSVVELNR